MSRTTTNNRLKYSFGNLLADCVAALTIIGAWWLLLWMFGAFH